MNILALDTSTDRAAVALATADGSRVSAPADAAGRHGRNLVPTLKALLAGAGVAPGALDLIAVGLGPGSYTGLRVGLMAAKTLAYALGKPLVGLDSLELVARNAPESALIVAAIADAQRGDLYAADFARSEPGAPLVRATETRVESIADWSARLKADTLVLGPGRRKLADPPAPARFSDRDADDWPAAGALIPLAREAWEAARYLDPWYIEPLYLRRSAAEDQWERAK